MPASMLVPLRPEPRIKQFRISAPSRAWVYVSPRLQRHLRRTGMLKNLGIVAARREAAAILVQAAHRAIVAEAGELRAITAHRPQLGPHETRDVLGPAVGRHRAPH